VLPLAPGERLTFGRGAPGSPVGLALEHPGVSRLAGEVAAGSVYWHLSNLSSATTYVVENPEGGGEYFKVPAGRVGVPVPFEISTVVLPAGRELVSFQVFAPGQPQRAETAATSVGHGVATACTFPLDESAKYFLVLVALCEPRLRGNSLVPLPTVTEIIRRVQPVPGCEELTERAVDFHIDYVARSKLRLRDADQVGQPRFAGRREAVAAFVLRFGLVMEHHLTLLPDQSCSGRASAGRASARRVPAGWVDGAGR
jgi:hypothetical protein